MELKIIDRLGATLSRGITDNPYQARNIIAEYIANDEHQFMENNHALITVKGNIRIYCSAEIPPILAPNPRIIGDTRPTPKTAAKGSVALATICRHYNLCPVRARRLLRRSYGVQGRKYVFSPDEVNTVLAILMPI